MSWTLVFLSYFMSAALLFVLLMLDWVQRNTRSRPSLVTLEKPKYIHGGEKKGDHQWQSDFKQEF